MRFFKIIFLLISLCGCKEEVKSQTNYPNNKKVVIFQNLIDRSELDLYLVNDYLLGEFYSPKSDSLIFYKIFGNKNLLLKMKNSCDLNCKKSLLKSNIDLFDIEEFKIDYKNVSEQKDAGGYDVFNLKKPFEVYKTVYNNNKTSVATYDSYNAFHSNISTNSYSWQGKYHFSLEDLARMGETHSVYFDFDISDISNPKIISQLDQQKKKIKNCQVTHITKDTLVLMDKSKNDDIYILSKNEENNYNIGGSVIYMLNPPNETYALTKEENT